MAAAAFWKFQLRQLVELVIEEIGLPESRYNQNTTVRKVREKENGWPHSEGFCVLKMGRTGSSVEETRLVLRVRVGRFTSDVI